MIIHFGLNIKGYFRNHDGKICSRFDSRALSHFAISWAVLFNFEVIGVSFTLLF